MDNPFKGLSRNAKIAVAIGGAGTAWLVWKQHKTSSATSASAIDPLTGLPYSQDNQVDPLTGEEYLAEAQEYGSVQAAENAVAGESSIDYSSAYGTGGGVAGTATSLVPANVTQGTTYASNAAWAQAVEAGLTDIGYTSTDIAAALGRYLGSLSLTPDQATIVQAAIAEYGPPPVGTFQVILAPATGSTGSGGSGTGTSTGTGGLPGLGSGPGSGTGSGSSGRLAAPSGVVLTGGKTGVKFTWQPVPGATGYVCLLKKGGENGPVQNGPFTVASPVCNFGGLTSLTQYTAFIWPSDAADQGGPGSSQPHYQHTFTTT